MLRRSWTSMCTSDSLINWYSGKKMGRDAFSLKTTHIVTFIEEALFEWATNYLTGRKDECLRRLVRRLIHRYGFPFRRWSRTVLPTVELEQVQQQYATTSGQ